MKPLIAALFASIFSTPVMSFAQQSNMPDVH